MHNWHKPRSKGRPNSNDTPPVDIPWIENVHCQRFFRSGAGSGWFEVDRKSGRKKAPDTTGLRVVGLPAEVSRLAPEVSGHLRGALQREQKYRAAENQPRVYSKVMGEISFTATSLWLERTQWPAMFRGCRRDILRAMTRLPKRSVHEAGYLLGQGPREGDPDIVSSSMDERKIVCILSAVDHVLDRCENTVKATNRSLLSWLVSSRIHVYGSKQFMLVAEESSRQQYRVVWKRFLAFVLRAFRLTPEARVQETKANIGEEIAADLHRVWYHVVWDPVDTSACSWPSKASSGERREDGTRNYWHFGDGLDNTEAYEREKDEEPGSEKLFHPQQNDIADSSEDESDSGDELFDLEGDDPVAVDAVDDSGFFNENETGAEHHTFQSQHDRHGSVDNETFVAEFLELLFRLNLDLCKEAFADGQPSSTLLIRFSGILGFSLDCRSFLLARQYCPFTSPLIYIQRLLFLEYALPLHPYTTLGIPRRPRTQQLEHLNHIREQYTVAGPQSPLAELVSLRNSARVIARNELPAFLLRWSENGDTVYWGEKHCLTMEDFPKLAAYFITQAEELCRTLMLGMRLDVVADIFVVDIPWVVIQRVINSNFTYITHSLISDKDWFSG